MCQLRLSLLWPSEKYFFCFNGDLRLSWLFSHQSHRGLFFLRIVICDTDWSVSSFEKALASFWRRAVIDWGVISPWWVEPRQSNLIHFLPASAHLRIKLHNHWLLCLLNDYWVTLGVPLHRRDRSEGPWAVSGNGVNFLEFKLARTNTTIRRFSSGIVYLMG